MRRKHADLLWRIAARVDDIAGALERIEDALDLATPGGLAAVMAEAKQARTAAESAFVGMQTLASQATAKPGVPELTRAVSAQTDTLRAMEAMVRAATGPQPALTEPEPEPEPEPAPVKPAPAAAGMGGRIPKTRSKP